jgi:hypothetical protein
MATRKNNPVDDNAAEDTSTGREHEDAPSPGPAELQKTRTTLDRTLERLRTAYANATSAAFTAWLQPTADRRVQVNQAATGAAAGPPGDVTGPVTALTEQAPELVEKYVTSVDGLWPHTYGATGPGVRASRLRDVDTERLAAQIRLLMGELGSALAVAGVERRGAIPGTSPASTTHILGPRGEVAWRGLDADPARISWTGPPLESPDQVAALADYRTTLAQLRKVLSALETAQAGTVANAPAAASTAPPAAKSTEPPPAKSTAPPAESTAPADS